MSNLSPNGAVQQPQGLPNAFAPQPVGPMAWNFVPGTIQGERAIVLVLMTPHSQVNYWFHPSDLTILLEQGRAALSGLIVPPPGASPLSPH